MAVETYTKSGAKATSPVKLDSHIFGLKEINHQLVKDAYLAYLANGRSNFAKTKKRGEVRGGGQKPWRQKGTGRARFGSSRNPIWTGGGVAFGPTGSENYNRKLNSKARVQALKQALSVAASENHIKVIDSLDFADGRVKPVLSILDKIKAEGRTLLVIDQKDAKSVQATRNIKHVNLRSARYLSVFDVMNADAIVFTKPAVEAVEAHLGGKDV